MNGAPRPERRARRGVDLRHLGLRLGLELAHHERRSRGHDGQLLTRDVRERRAEPARVLEPDVGEHRDRRVEHVGRVVAPAEARLHHRDLDPALGELGERRGGQQLELRHALAARQRAVDLDRRGGRALDGGAERVRLDVGVADADALGEGRQVRREVGARAHAVGVEDRRRHADGRALAVRADDVDRAERALRAAEHGQQPAHPLEAELHAEQLEREQVVLGTLQRPAHPSASSSACRRASFARSASTTCGGALATKPWLASLPSARSISPSSVSAPPPRGAPRPRCRPRRRRGSRRCPRDRDGGHGRRPVVGPLDARKPADGVGGALVALGLEPRLQRTARRGADAVAPARAAPGRRRSRGRARPRRPRRRALVGRRPRPGHQQVLAAGEIAPDLLRHERDHGVRERERLAQDVQRDRGDLGVVVRVEARLDQLEVPVAEVAVDEVVEAERRAVELEVLERRLRRRLGALQAREDPRVLDRDRARLGQLGRDAQQQQPRRVPELVGELAALGDLVLVEADVLRRGHREQAEAHRVGAVGGELAALLEDRRARAAVDQAQRVDAGAERLRHPPPVGRLDERVDVDVGERDVVRELEAEHDHPRDPEEDDVAARGEHVGRVERAQLRRVLGPAERRERPQARGEPGVEDVGVLDPAVALGRLGAAVGLLAAVPDGDPVPPPQLARDAPGADVLHPLEVAPALALGPDARRGRRGRPRARAAASSSMRMNHCSEISGSMRSPERCENGTLCV